MFIDFSQPSLGAGIALLRDQTKWPEGFTWDYSCSGKCAMGLFRDTWAQTELPTSSLAAKLVGIDITAAHKIFCHYDDKNWGNVTAEDIAVKLEELV